VQLAVTTPANKGVWTLISKLISACTYLLRLLIDVPDFYPFFCEYDLYPFLRGLGLELKLETRELNE
jgi:hypothetical protein